MTLLTKNKRFFQKKQQSNYKVITNYNPKCFYQIKDIDYNVKLNNISINVKENDGSIKEKSIIEYYEEKYDDVFHIELVLRIKIILC